MLKKISILLILLLAVTSISFAAKHKKIDVTEAVVITSSDQKDSKSLFHLNLGDDFKNKDKKIDYAAIELSFEVPDDSIQHFMLSIHPMKTSWDKNNVSWNSFNFENEKPYYEEIGMAVPVSAKRDYKVRIVVTELIQLLADAEFENNGFIIVSDHKIKGRGKLKKMLSSSSLIDGTIELYYGKK